MIVSYIIEYNKPFFYCTESKLFFLDISPIAFTLGSISIYWYGLIYAASILVSWKFASYIISNTPQSPSKEEFEQFIFSCILACVIGARLGHILFFEFEYYLKHPIEIVMLRNGGMSFHGAVLALAIVGYIFSRRHTYNIKIIADILSFAGSIGIFLGRIANFINQELYGLPTGVNWAVIFSYVDPLPRHPTQLYESFFEGLVSFWLMLIVWAIRGSKSIGTGVYAFIFFSIYSISRFFIEFFKDVETINCFGIIKFTIGQILSIALLLFAILILNIKKGQFKSNFS